ncbi:hypothetical protein [Ammoniphilus sp. 3BR4]|uniref:hypothetical protein n=1 Tax=Ammoniphilus sp. 3BR4 TaxID=3158265 RepID=UPI0034664F14
MKWAEVRNRYPERIVLIEAIKAFSKDRVRTIEEMTVVEEYFDSKEAWIGYKNYHKQYPERELYLFHTGKENIEVIEQYFTGVRNRL